MKRPPLDNDVYRECPGNFGPIDPSRVPPPMTDELVKFKGGPQHGRVIRVECHRERFIVAVPKRPPSCEFLTGGPTIDEVPYDKVMYCRPYPTSPIMEFSA